MDRREALKKLGAGGAIAAGASVVLGSTDVAYAASTPPPPNSATFTLSPPGGEFTNVTATFPPTDCTQVGWAWTLNGKSTTPDKAVVSLVVGNSNPGELQKTHNGNSGDWRTTDTVSMTLVVQWNCGGTIVTETYGPQPATF